MQPLCKPRAPPLPFRLHPLSLPDTSCRRSNRSASLPAICVELPFPPSGVVFLGAPNSFIRLTGLLFLLLIVGGVARSQTPAIPPTPREFRGVWIATHLNIDWPSRKGLPSAQQQAELVAILDRAVSMNANAIILQVRPTGETLYASDIEPWAAVLSGTQGTPPSPPYDPLAFALREAHARGLQVHAWLNPFRVGVSSSRNTSPRHVTKTRPDLVVRYGDNQWMDPGHPDTHEYVVRIVRELI